jgi:NADH:ubiquinone oxidoreductase subunit 5 (subunit L)/multisubunit Na+/H+ antiporter MnhA subunit
MPAQQQALNVSGNCQQIMNRYFIPIILIAVLGNILGYWVKSIVKKNGYSVNYFSGHFQDTKNLFKLAKSTVDKNSRLKYLIIGFGEIGLAITFVVFGVLLFLSFPSLNDSACNRLKDFKSYKYDYLVVNKYLDSTQHSYATLVLQDSQGNKFPNQDLIMDNSGLFDFLSVGDSIKKKPGTVFVEVKNNITNRTFEVDFGCDK